MILDQRAYWVWLQHAFPIGSEKPISIGRRFDDLEEFYKGGKNLWYDFEFIKDMDVKALESFTPENAMAQIEYCESCGQEVITYGDYLYPEKLMTIPNPPAVLYVKGEIPDFDTRLTISVVGTRKASDTAISITEKISNELSNEGAIVVSGGALGIDTASHKGALLGKNPTVAVLACGLDYPYLMQNQSLREKIVENAGALITEYPINTAVNKGSFLIRNRIIAGLCDGLLVSECGNKGGTMITVKHAIEQNKQVFAFPAQVGNDSTQGTNKLIQDGAIPVLEVKDILGEFSDKYIKESQVKKENLGKEENFPQGLSKNAIMIYTIMDKEKLQLNQIAEKTGLRISQVLSAVTELELEGYIKSYSGQRFLKANVRQKEGSDK